MENKLIQRLQILLKEQNATQYKQEMYSQYGVTSSKDMSETQLRHLIASLNGSGGVSLNDAKKALRSVILKTITAPATGIDGQKGLAIPNSWGFINPFIKKHGGKRLPDMTIEELKAFKMKLYAIRKSGWYYKDGSNSVSPIEPPPTVNILISMPTPAVMS